MEPQSSAAVAPTSLWNNGTGWEERNHSALSEAALRSALPALSVQGQVGKAGRLVVTVRGLGEGSRVESSVNLRRGRAISVFDFSLSLPWDAVWIPAAAAAPAPSAGGSGAGEADASGDAAAAAGAGGGTLFSSGLLTTHGVGPDDVEEDFPISLRITHAPAAATPAMTTLLRAVRELASGPLCALLRKTLRAMAAWLLTLESGEAAQSTALERRKEEAALAARAGGSCASGAPSSGGAASGGSGVPLPAGAGPQRVAPLPQPPAQGAALGAEAAAAAAAASTAHAPDAAPSSRGVRAMPLVAAAAEMAACASASAVALPVAAHRVVGAGEAPELSASKWNKGGWGYEDKDISPWARKHLLAQLNGFDISMPGGNVKVVDVEDLRGEAAIILRRVRGGVVV